jgi:hypothetical protein
MFIVDTRGEKKSVKLRMWGLFAASVCHGLKTEALENSGVRQLINRRKSNSWNHKLINAVFQEHSFNYLPLMIPA